MSRMIEVRPARPDDADALAAAHVEGWRVGYRGVVPDHHLDAPEFAGERLARWRAWTWNAGGASALFAGVLDGRVVGFGLCGPERPEPVAVAPRGEVYAFYLHPDAWGSGVAAALMEACEAWLREQGFADAVLWVLRDNPRGRAFYGKVGWVATGREQHFEGPQAAGSALPFALVEVEYRRSL